MMQASDRPFVSEILSLPIMTRALALSVAREEHAAERHLLQAIPTLQSGSNSSTGSGTTSMKRGLTSSSRTKPRVPIPLTPDVAPVTSMPTEVSDADSDEQDTPSVPKQPAKAVLLTDASATQQLLHAAQSHVVFPDGNSGKRRVSGSSAANRTMMAFDNLDSDDSDSSSPASGDRAGGAAVMAGVNGEEYSTDTDSDSQAGHHHGISGDALLATGEIPTLPFGDTMAGAAAPPKAKPVWTSPSVAPPVAQATPAQPVNALAVIGAPPSGAQRRQQRGGGGGGGGRQVMLTTQEVEGGAWASIGRGAAVVSVGQLQSPSAAAADEQQPSLNSGSLAVDEYSGDTFELDHSDEPSTNGGVSASTGEGPGASNAVLSDFQLSEHTVEFEDKPYRPIGLPPPPKFPQTTVPPIVATVQLTIPPAAVRQPADTTSAVTPPNRPDTTRKVRPPPVPAATAATLRVKQPVQLIDPDELSPDKVSNSTPGLLPPSTTSSSTALSTPVTATVTQTTAVPMPTLPPPPIPATPSINVLSSPTLLATPSPGGRVVIHTPRLFPMGSSPSSTPLVLGAVAGSTPAMRTPSVQGTDYDSGDDYSSDGDSGNSTSADEEQSRQRSRSLNEEGLHRGAHHNRARSGSVGGVPLSNMADFSESSCANSEPGYSTDSDHARSSLSDQDSILDESAAVSVAHSEDDEHGDHDDAESVPDESETTPTSSEPAQPTTSVAALAAKFGKVTSSYEGNNRYVCLSLLVTRMLTHGC